MARSTDSDDKDSELGLSNANTTSPNEKERDVQQPDFALDDPRSPRNWSKATKAWQLGAIAFLTLLS